MIPPFISIIIPTYNSAQTLAICLESVLNQTFENFEVIVLDGLSSDKTISLIKSYADSNENIKYLSRKDRGIYDAMNNGIRLARGNWIYFLGSDDTLFETDTLSNVVEQLQTNTADVIYGNVFSKRFSGIYAGKFDEEKLFYTNICHQSIFFRKSVFEKIGNFDLRFKSHADYDHNLKWFLSTKIKHQYVNLIIANYADGGFSSVTDDIDFRKVKKWKYSFLIRRQIGKKAKVRIATEEFFNALKQGRFENAVDILVKAPIFLFN